MNNRNELQVLRTTPMSAQRGAVLIVSMVLLAVVTILGVVSMTTTSLEEKMAANTQESHRAFHAAETGLSNAFATVAAYDISGVFEVLASLIDLPGNMADTETDYNTNFVGWSPPPIGSLFSATSFQAANFDFSSTGKTPAGAPATEQVTVELHGGAFQIAPR